jgi:hypothetical protein
MISSIVVAGGGELDVLGAIAAARNLEHGTEADPVVIRRVAPRVHGEDGSAAPQ